MKKSKLRKIIPVIMSAALALNPIGAGTASAAKKPVLNKKNLEITVGQKTTLKVKNKIKGASYKWTSSKNKVAKVTKKGVVQGIKNGKATITCKVKAPKTKTLKARTYNLKCKVTVKKKSDTKPTTKPVIEPTTQPSFETDATPAASPVTKPETNPEISPNPSINPSEITVTTQKDLEIALKTTGIHLLTLKTDATETYVIPKGNYTDIELIVDAPNAEIDNSGIFKHITVNAIKSDTFFEKAIGNSFNWCSVKKGRLVLTKDSSIKQLNIHYNEKTEIQKKPELKIELLESSTINTINIETPTDLLIMGNSGTIEPVNLLVSLGAANSIINTSVKLNIDLMANAKLVFEKGSENSTINTSSNTSVNADIQNNTGNTINITKPNGETETIGTGTVNTTPPDYYPPIFLPITKQTPAPSATLIPDKPAEDINLSLETGWITNWNSSKIVSETAFSQYSVDFLTGKKISIAYTVDEGGWTNLGVFAGSNEYDEGNFITIKATGSTDSKTGYSFDITPEIAEKLISGGLYIAADHAVINSVKITTKDTPSEPGNTTEPDTSSEPGNTTEPSTPPEPGDTTEPSTPPGPGDTTEPSAPPGPGDTTEPSAPPEDISLSLETDWTADWNSSKIVNETTFSQYSVDFLAGKEISIAYTVDDAGYTNLGVFAGSNEYDEGNFITIKATGSTDSKTGYSFDITPEIAEKLISGGLYVAADHAVINSVKIIAKDSAAEKPSDDITLPLETDWTADWNSSKIVSETAFSQYSVDFLTGKKISIAYTVDEGGWTNLGVFAGSNEYDEGNFITIKATGSTDSKTGYSFDITPEIAEKLISGGLYVAADHAVINSIMISSSGN